MSFPEQIRKKEAEFLVRPSAAIREIQEKNLRRQISLCAQYSDYYRRLFTQEGIDPASIRTLEDLRMLPLTFREDFLREPESFKMHVEKGSIYERIIWNVCYTTSFVAGKPSPFYNTSHDYLSMIHQGRRLASFLNLTSDDVIINLFPLSPMPNVGYLLVPARGSGLSLPVIDAIPGSIYPPYPVTHTADHCASIIQRHGGTLIWGVSSFVRKVIMRAQEKSMDFSYLRIVVLSGEPTPLEMVEDIRIRLAEVGAPHARIIRSYGFTELQAGLLECTPQSGFHCLSPEDVYLEVVDPITRKPLHEGKEGLVVLTHLDRRGTVLLRYATGDRSSISNDPCPHCGANMQRILKEPYYTCLLYTSPSPRD